MAFNSLGFYRMLKGLFIECFALGMAFLSDYVIENINEHHPDVRFSMNVRVFYFSKNVLYLLDSLCVTKDNNLRHLFSGTFNLGVGAAIYPASTDLPIIASQSVLFVVGSFARFGLEKIIMRQSIVQHLKLHRGKLIFGAAGIFLSVIPSIGMSSPAFYWSGELYDVWAMREKGETLFSILCHGKSTVPIQAFSAVFVKFGLDLSGHSSVVPVFAIDGIIGSAHQLIIGVLGSFRSDLQPPKDDQQPGVTGACAVDSPEIGTPTVSIGLPDKRPPLVKTEPVKQQTAVTQVRGSLADNEGMEEYHGASASEV